MRKIEDLKGQKFGRLTVKERIGQTSKWLCDCECGYFKIVRGCDLKSGCVKSCGCLKKEQDKYNLKSSKTHNKSNTRLYRIWSNMKDRCINPKNKRYNRYGERGITFCDEWIDFENFYNWAIQNGYKENLTLDRINNDLNYCPDNCRWANSRQQARNRSTNIFVEYKGQEMTLIELSEKIDIDYNTLKRRYVRGDRGEYLIRPINKTVKKRGTYNNHCKINEDIAREIKERIKQGQKGSEIAKEFGVSKYLVSDIKRGKTWAWI